MLLAVLPVKTSKARLGLFLGHSRKGKILSFKLSGLVYNEQFQNKLKCEGSCQWLLGWETVLQDHFNVSMKPSFKILLSIPPFQTAANLFLLLSLLKDSSHIHFS